MPTTSQKKENGGKNHRWAGGQDDLKKMMRASPFLSQKIRFVGRKCEFLDKKPVGDLSDKDLREELTSYGFSHAGPITPSTRKVYEKKLENFRKTAPASESKI